jgi:LPPG:FO 2-phospho-L-lactate transferase
VSPIVGQAPVSGPAGKMMAAKGFEVSALGVAAVYEGLLDQLVVDSQDAPLVAQLEAKGVRALVTSSIMTDAQKERALALAVLEGPP